MKSYALNVRKYVPRDNSFALSTSLWGCKPEYKQGELLVFISYQQHLH
jgi:hypothetical protein